MHDLILKNAKECRTKAHWESWLLKHGASVENANESKLLEDVFKLLKKDAQSIHYGASLWACLLEGCLSSWNLELGVRIVEFTQKIKSPSITLPAAKIYLESGFPLKARKMVASGQRLANLQTREKLQLDTINCSTYIEEGKRPQATRILKKIETSVESNDLSPRDQADFLTYVARTLFLLGRYKEASRFFEKIAKVYKEEQVWEQAAKSIFNAAASLENAGEGTQEYAYSLVEKCRRLSEEHNLKGPLAHCYAFYGHNDYWCGNFAGARDHYKKALQHYPSSDNSYRRLHLLSMLAFTYLRTGRINLAKRYGTQTLELAAQEETDRFALRYDNLEAELLWEEGEFEKSQELLTQSTAPLMQKGVHTLEDLAIVSRYIYQSALLGDLTLVADFEVSKDLEKNTAAQQEYIHALAQHSLIAGDFTKSEQLFHRCLNLSRTVEDQYYRSLSFLGLVEIGLARGDKMDSIEHNLNRFQIHLGRMIETPLKNRLHMALAAISYRAGDLKKCLEHLNRVGRSSRAHFSDDLIVKTWISTLEGKATRFSSTHHEKIMANLTRIYFAPTVKRVSQKRYKISEVYEVDLENHSALADLLNYLMDTEEQSASPESIQSDVWKQSVNQQGWQQKIRNTINRLRQLFPQTMAPLIIHDKQIRIFSSAIEVQTQTTAPRDNKDRILLALRKAPKSTTELSLHLNLSPATTKRVLKQLTQNNLIISTRIGRNIYYQGIENLPH